MIKDLLASEVDRIKKETREQARRLLYELALEIPEVKNSQKFAQLERILTHYAL